MQGTFCSVRAPGPFPVVPRNLTRCIDPPVTGTSLRLHPSPYYRHGSVWRCATAGLVHHLTKRRGAVGAPAEAVTFPSACCRRSNYRQPHCLRTGVGLIAEEAKWLYTLENPAPRPFTIIHDNGGIMTDIYPAVDARSEYFSCICESSESTTGAPSASHKCHGLFRWLHRPAEPHQGKT